MSEFIDHINYHIGYVAIGFLANQAEEVDVNRLDVNIGRAYDMIKKSKQMFWPLRIFSDTMLLDAVSAFTNSLRYAHCEVAFFLKAESRQILSTRLTHEGHPIGMSICVGLGVDGKKGVFMKLRRYTPNYVWLYIPCSETGMRSMYKWSIEQLKKKFSEERMSRVAVLPAADDSEEYFCSYLTMAALQFTPLVAAHLNPPHALTVDEVYDILQDDNSSLKTVFEFIPVEHDRRYNSTPMIVPSQFQNVMRHAI